MSLLFGDLLWCFLANVCIPTAIFKKIIEADCLKQAKYSVLMKGEKQNQKEKKNQAQ